MCERHSARLETPIASIDVPDRIRELSGTTSGRNHTRPEMSGEVCGRTEGKEGLPIFTDYQVSQTKIRIIVFVGCPISPLKVETMPEDKQNLPMISPKNWFAIRGRLQDTLQLKLTPKYVADFLGMQEGSARANVVSSLKLTGLIDSEGKPTELARRWRDDEDYPDVCNEIRLKTYPEELLKQAPSASVGREVVERWISKNVGVGADAAKKQAAFYILLCEADPSGQAGNLPKPAAPSKSKVSSKQPKPAANPTVAEPSSDVAQAESPDVAASPSSSGAQMPSPSLHVDIQIHISPETTFDQIDKIFESMAKYLRGS